MAEKAGVFQRELVMASITPVVSQCTWTGYYTKVVQTGNIPQFLGLSKY